MNQDKSFTINKKNKIIANNKKPTINMAAPLQMPLIAPFDPSDEPSSIAQRWQKWVKSFHYCLVAYGITNATR